MNDRLTVLSNGIKIVMLPKMTEPSITVGFFIGAGSRNETQDEYGICHLLEHMMFKETTHRRNGTLYQSLDLLGATYNAVTSTDYTYFYINALAKNNNLLLDVILDIYLNLRVSDESLQIEKQVVCAEMRMREDQPFIHLYSKMHRKYFRNTTLAHDIIGNARCLASFTGNDLIQFKKTHFKPEKSVFVISGFFDTHAVMQSILPTLSNISNRTVRFELPDERAMIEQNFKNQCEPCVYIKKVEGMNQCYTLISFPLYDLYHTHRYEIDILIKVLSFGLSSKLYSSLREEKGLIYTLKMRPIVYSDCSLLVIQTVIHSQSLDEVLLTIFDQFLHVKKHKITNNQWITAKNALLNRSTVGPIDSWINNGLAVLFNDRKGYSQKSNRSKIRKIAEQVFVQDQLNLFLYGNVQFNYTPILF